MQTVMQSYITFEVSLASIYMYITMNSYEDGCRFLSLRMSYFYSMSFIIPCLYYISTYFLH